MIDLATLMMFSTAVIVLMMSPGPNMAFVIAHGVSYGWRGGVSAALGIAAADVVLTTLTAAGVTAIVVKWPPAINLIRIAGAAYLLHMAWKALRNRNVLQTGTATHKSLGSVWVHSMMNSLFNPKALLFFVVFLPQFVDAGKGSIAQQLIVLGGILTVISIVFHSILGIAGGAINKLFSGSEKAARRQSWCMAFVFTALAIRLVLSLDLR